MSVLAYTKQYFLIGSKVCMLQYCNFGWFKLDPRKDIDNAILTLEIFKEVISSRLLLHDFSETGRIKIVM